MPLFRSAFVQDHTNTQHHIDGGIAASSARAEAAPGVSNGGVIVIRNFVRAAIVFGLLAGGYQGYIRGFARLERALRPELPALPVERLKVSEFKQRSIRLAELAFGPTHWTTAPDLPWRYNNNARGYWMYAKEQSLSADRKRVTFSPFALVIRDGNGRAVKSVRSERAEVEMDKPFNTRNALPSRIVYARIDGGVVIQDHGETLDDPLDDMIISTPYVEFSERDRTIRGDAPVKLWHPKFQVSGVGLTIDLVSATPDESGAASRARNREASSASGDELDPTASGFSGVRAVRLDRDIHIFARDAKQTEGLFGPSSKPGPEGGPGPRRGRPGAVVTGSAKVEVDPDRFARERVGPADPNRIPIPVALRRPPADDPAGTSSEAAAGDADANPETETEGVPVELVCDGPMRIELPPAADEAGSSGAGAGAAVASASGAEAESAADAGARVPRPTIAYFYRNVKVSRGLENHVDQLNCDSLEITLMPIPPEPEEILRGRAGQATVDFAAELVALSGLGFPAPLLSGAFTAAHRAALPKTLLPPKNDDFNNLGTRKVLAEGDAVWLQSQDEGLVVKGQRLLFERSEDPTEPDLIHFDGGETSRLFVEQTQFRDRATRDEARSVIRITSRDALIRDQRSKGGGMKLVARGPGRLEERDPANQVVQRVVLWRDRLDYEEPDPDRRIVTLIGQPNLYDSVRRDSLRARNQIKLWFKARPRPESGAGANPNPNPDGSPSRLAGGDRLDIERMFAESDARLETPIHLLVAHDRLDAIFLDPEPGAATATATATRAAVDGEGEGGAGSVGPRPTPTAFVRAQPPSQPQPPIAGTGAAPGDEDDDAVAVQAPRGQGWDVEARTVWVELRPVGGGRAAGAAPGPVAVAAADPAGSTPAPARSAGGGEFDKWDIHQTFLRGDVKAIQEPKPNEVRGLEVRGQALDIEGVGADRYKLRVAARDPAAPPREGRPAFARVLNDKFAIEGPLLAVDQEKDFAYVDGPGKLVNWGRSGLFEDIRKTAPPPGEGPAPDAGRVVTPTSRRQETGGGAPAARGANGNANGNGNGNGNGNATPPAAPPSPPAEPQIIAWSRGMTFEGRVIEADGTLRPARARFRGDVRGDLGDSMIQSAELETYFDQTVSFTETARLQGGLGGLAAGAGASAAATASAADDGFAPTPIQLAWARATGSVNLLQRKNEPRTGALSKVLRLSGPIVVFDRLSDSFQVDGPGIVYQFTYKPRARNENGAAGAATASARPTPDWELNRIQFEEGMVGKLGLDESGSLGEDGKPAARQAVFRGEVRMIQARVASSNQDVNPDALPEGYRRLNSRWMIVDSLPPPPEAPPEEKEWILAEAVGQANARTEKTSIQGDVIRYDSLKQTVRVFGNNGRDVVIVQQDKPGQPASYGQSAAVLYNLRTNDASVFNPRGFNLVDGRSGPRLTAPGPAAPRVSDLPRPRDRFPRPGSGGDDDRPRVGQGNQRGMMGAGGLGGAGAGPRP